MACEVRYNWKQEAYLTDFVKRHASENRWIRKCWRNNQKRNPRQPLYMIQRDMGVVEYARRPVVLPCLHIYNVAETKTYLPRREKKKKKQKIAKVLKRKSSTGVWVEQRRCGDSKGMFAMTCEMLSASFQLLKKSCAFHWKHWVIWWIWPISGRTLPVGCGCSCGCEREILNHKI